MADPIGFVGYGRFGQALGERFREEGLPVLAWDPDRELPADLATADLADLASRARVLFLATPVAAMESTLAALRPHLTPDHTVLDVGSVKTGPLAAMSMGLGKDIPWCGTHPLFGPVSLARGERPLRAVVCPNPIHPSAADTAKELFTRIGCEIVEQDAEGHDEAMAEGHALAYFVAKAFLDADIDLSQPWSPPSVQAIARTVDAVRADAAHLFATLHRENPYAAGARRRLLDALERTDEALRAPPPADEVAHAETGALHIAEAAPVSPDLLEARDQIDALDRDLLELLGRRAELSLRAARAKAEVGRSIRDPEREERMLAARKEAAASLGLDGDRVAEIFAAIVSFSRQHQNRHGPA